MKNIFIGDVFEKDLDLFFKKQGKFNFSGTQFNLNVIKSFNFDYIISCPSIGHFPITSKSLFLKKPSTKSNINFVKYCNIIGLNAYSSEHSINKMFREFKINQNEELNIFISELKYQFLASALKIKKNYPKSKIIAIVMDVPFFIGESKKSFIYKILKSIGNKKALKLTKKVDGFVFLSEKMNFLNTTKAPYKVFPFIYDGNLLCTGAKKPNSIPIISYCGVISKQFNFDLFLKAIPLINDENIRFEIAGDGDCRKALLDLAKKDPRIIYHGLVSREKAEGIQRNSNILVNPRLPSYYTSYSFPSKIAQFLSTGNVVISYVYDSFPKSLKEEIVVPSSETSEGFAHAINKVINEKTFAKNTNRIEILSKFNLNHLKVCLLELISEVRK